MMLIEVNVSCPNVDKSFKKISETDVNKFLNWPKAMVYNQITT